MTDLLREIDEELERERMFALWAKYKSLILTLACGLIIGTASYTAWQDHTQTENTKRSIALFDIMARTTQPEAEKLEALQSYGHTYKNEGQAILAQFLAAELLMRSKQVPQAVAALEKLAQDKSLSDVMQQYAGLMAIQLQLDTGDAVVLHQKIAPLTAPGQPWRFSALTMKALLLARDGDRAQAQAIFAAMEKDKEAPSAMRSYVHDLAVYYATKE
jgi:hypothetical protein